MTSIKKEIMEALDEQLNDLFNLAGLTLTAFIRKDINQDERDAILGEFNELGLNQIEAALTRIEEETMEKALWCQFCGDELSCFGCEGIPGRTMEENRKLLLASLSLPQKKRNEMITFIIGLIIGFLQW